MIFVTVPLCKKLYDVVIKFENMTIICVECAKYQGMMLDPQLTFQQCLYMTNQSMTCWMCVGKKHTVTNMYKVEHSLMPDTITSLFTKVAHRHNTRSMTSWNFYLLRRRPEYGKCCFTYRGSLLWTYIPMPNMYLPSIEAFKKELDKLTWSDRPIT